MSKERILILGAGLAGLSAAWHLYRKRIESLVFEKEKEVGGLCRSKSIDGFAFDYSGHLLHFKHHYTLNLIKGLLGDNLFEHRRRAFVYFHDKYMPYPFQANLHGLPSSIAKDCLLGFIKVKQNGQIKEKNNLNFLDWIEQTLGKGIAQHFMIPYNTKFWTIPPQELTCEWLDGLIPIPSLEQIVEGTVEESHEQFGYNTHFWYPKRGGINQVPLALANEVKNIYTNCQIIEINLAKKEIKTASGEQEKFDYLISTIPLPEIPSLIKDMPKEINSLFRRLRWNSIFNLNLGIEIKNDSNKHWIYFPQKELCFFRIGFPHNFSSSLTPQAAGSLYIEVSYSKEKPINKNNIVSCIKKDLKKIGVLSIGDRILVEDINDIEYGYPIYDKNYAPARKKIINFLLKHGIITCGRYGSWRYMTMEDTLWDGKDAASLIEKKRVL